jgi:type IV fimbrial biogenesis protein FimT
MPKYSFKTQAFTLIELVMTMAIAGILVTIAIPSFNSTLTSSRLTNYANDLVGALNLARSEAVRRGVSVTVRKLDNDSYTKIGPGVNWETGWDIFTDINNDGKFDVGDELIRTYVAQQSSYLHSSYTLRGNNNFANYIRYTPLGTSNSIGSFVICDNSDGNNAPEAYTSKLITINFSGRPHMGVDSNDNGIPEKENGTEIISCTVSPF